MKASFTLLLILATTLILAQDKKENFSIEKGTWTLATDLSIHSSKNESFYETDNDGTKHFRFDIYPKVGFAVNKNLILGLALGYSYSKNNQLKSQTYEKGNSFSISPYIKKFFPVNQKLAFSLQGETKFELSKRTSPSDSFERVSNDKRFFIGIKPGIDLYLTEKLLLQANYGSLGYSSSSQEIELNSLNKIKERHYKSTNFNFNFQASSLMVGLTLLL